MRKMIHSEMTDHSSNIPVVAVAVLEEKVEWAIGRTNLDWCFDYHALNMVMYCRHPPLTKSTILTRTILVIANLLGRWSSCCCCCYWCSRRSRSSCSSTGSPTAVLVPGAAIGTEIGKSYAILWSSSFINCVGSCRTVVVWYRKYPINGTIPVVGFIMVPWWKQWSRYLSITPVVLSSAMTWFFFFALSLYCCLLQRFVLVTPTSLLSMLSVWAHAAWRRRSVKIQNKIHIFRWREVGGDTQVHIALQ